MGKTLYLECTSGISGDMFVAALLDLGADREELEKVLISLPLEGFETEISRVKKSGLDVCDFAVKLDEAHENHDHDMDYLYGPGKEHPHHPHPHHHEHRTYGDILVILEKTEMNPAARALAGKIFRILGEAEARAHGVSLEEVHFHEVGAVDSIVDIVSAAVCFCSLDIEKVIIPELCEGKGQVRCQHGLLPVPVPAVVNIAEAYGLPLSITETKGELVTPTGAAIAAALRTGETLPQPFQIEKVGLGAGKRNYERPGILRAMLIRPVQEREMDRDLICKLETNLDDCTGEQLGFVMDRLMEAGARDVHYTPVFMKKNRPGYQLNVICDGEKAEELERIIFRETTTIGIRRVFMERHVLPRESLTVETPLGEAGVKVCTLPDGEKRFYPEYETASRLAREKGIPLEEVYEEIRSLAKGTSVK